MTSTPMHIRLAELAAKVGTRGGQCSARGCTRPRYRVGSYCSKHERHRQVYGDAEVMPVSKAELRPHRKLAERVVKANAHHPAIRECLDAIKDLLDRGTEAAEYVRSRPRPRDYSARVALELHRLNVSGATPFEILVNTASVLLYENHRSMKAAVLFCLVARSCLLIRKRSAPGKVGDLFRDDPRYGARPYERCSMNARIQIGQRFAKIVGVILPAIEEAVDGAIAEKQRRNKVALEALQEQPLKLPRVHRSHDQTLLKTLPPPPDAVPAGGTRITTAGGTTLTSYSNPSNTREERSS